MRQGSAEQRSGVLVVLAVVAAFLSACSSGDRLAPGTIRVVASTDVWGAIAGDIGGKQVAVTSILSEPDQDPHSYEPDARTALETAKADIVIENGGGYDDFVGQLLRASNSAATVLDAVSISGLKPDASGDLNEHVWFDLTAVKRVAAALAADLARREPSYARYFRANLTRFDTSVDALAARERHLSGRFTGVPVAITEALPLYMLGAIGARNATPRAFSRAVEDGADVSVSVLEETLQLFQEHRVRLLAYNEQTSGAITDEVLAAAKAAAIPVVPVTETLPPDATYLTWMRQNLAAITTALSAR